jgi:hypothetical protein
MGCEVDDETGDDEEQVDAVAGVFQDEIMLVFRHGDVMRRHAPGVKRDDTGGSEETQDLDMDKHADYPGPTLRQADAAPADMAERIIQGASFKARHSRQVIQSTSCGITGAVARGFRRF